MRAVTNYLKPQKYTTLEILDVAGGERSPTSTCLSSLTPTPNLPPSQAAWLLCEGTTAELWEPWSVRVYTVAIRASVCMDNTVRYHNSSTV